MSGMQRITTRIELTIKSGESESEMFSFGAYAGGTIFMPAGWDAADVGYLSSATGESGYQPLQKDGGLVTSVVAADAAVVMPADLFAAADLKLQSHNAGTPVNQTADRKIVLILKS